MTDPIEDGAEPAPQPRFITGSTRVLHQDEIDRLLGFDDEEEDTYKVTPFAIEPNWDWWNWRLGVHFVTNLHGIRIDLLCFSIWIQLAHEGHAHG